MKPCLYLFVILCATQSCVSVKRIKHADAVNLKQQPAAINGTYRNRLPDDTAHKTPSLWSLLTQRPNGGQFSTAYDYPGAVVRFTSINKKRLQAQLIRDTTVVAQLILKGKTKQDYFSVRNRVKYAGVPAIYMLFSNYKLHIGRSTLQQQLYIDGVDAAFAWIALIAAGGKDDQFNYKF